MVDTPESLREALGAELAAGRDGSALDARYKALHPGEANINDGGVSAGPPPDQNQQDASTEAQLLKQADEQGRAEWGEAHEANIQLAVQTAGELFAEVFPDPAEAQQVARNVQAAMYAGGVDLHTINKILVAIGKRGK